MAQGGQVMKNVYKWMIASFCAVVMVACSEDFLTRDPYGSTITQGQFEKLANQLEGSMRGIYSMMYNVTDHDEFGKRSIDMYTDIMSSDMALTNYTYGWFYTDEAGQGRTGRTAYIWYFYYGMLHNVNAVLFSAQGGNAASADNVIKRIDANGLPNKSVTKSGETTYYTISGTDTLASFTETEAQIANLYAQALTMRGYIYSNLVMLYCDQSRDIADFSKELAFPMYTEDNMNEAQPLATMSEVYAQLESDLTTAIAYFNAFSTIERKSKLEVNKAVACGILAYSYLNKGKGNKGHGDAQAQIYTHARDYALEAISSGTSSVLPRAQLFETGFNDVNTNCWIWGQDVTTETAGGLASFFGQVDIHSYSYAWAGDTKAIDANLYDSIAKANPWDARVLWFNDGSANATYKLCPDGKFYSAKNRYSTKDDDIDREWLSDNVFMRVEAMYLIAAEASYRLNNDGEAITYLTTITDQRIAEGKEDAYNDFTTNYLGGPRLNILKAIEYNWRVEMWGEGYGLQTFRRLAAEVLDGTERKRGSNHCSNAGSTIKGGSEYTFQMPSSEGSYNPSINTTTLP